MRILLHLQVKALLGLICLHTQFDDGAGLYSMELHHMLGREGNNYYLFFEISPEGHAIVDPFRFIK